MGAGSHHGIGPGVALRNAPILQRRNQTGPNERALATTRSTDDGEKAIALEMLEQPLHVGLATEEVLGVLLVERLKTAIGTDILVRLDRLGRTERDSLD